MQISKHVLTGNRFLDAAVMGDADLKNGQPVDSRFANEKTHPIRVVIAGGGTGGHLFPGIAVAEEVLARNTESDILFIGTGRTFETSVLADKGFRHEAITVQELKGKGVLKQAWACMLLPFSLLASARILKAFNPDLVMGVGGYSAGPVVVAAWMAGIKTALQEQNILPGITNRMLSRFVDRLYLSFKQTRGMGRADKGLVTGNPVRHEFLASVTSMDRAPSKAGTRTSRFTVLIAGGSQGAHAINMTMLSAIGCLQKSDRFYFIHQTGPADEARIKEAYASGNVGSTVKAFFEDMARQYQKADLIICRAGATTVAELTVLGKSVIFVPYPHAADDHQRLNAESLVKAGASEMIHQKDLTGELLARRIEHYADSPEELTEMGSRAGRLGRPDAARTIVDDMYEFIHK